MNMYFTFALAGVAQSVRISFCALKGGVGLIPGQGIVLGCWFDPVGALMETTD